MNVAHHGADVARRVLGLFVGVLFVRVGVGVGQGFWFGWNRLVLAWFGVGACQVFFILVKNYLSI